MELKHLRYFIQVAKLEHVTQAAEVLMVSQPFLTKIIRQLEEELGVDLFDHVGRKIQLNEFGKAFYIRAQKILHDLESAQSELNEMSGRVQNTITMITNVGLYMPELLAKFHKAYPNLTIEQTSAKRLRIIESLRDGSADFALVAPMLEPDPDDLIHTEVVINDTAYALLPPHHPLKNRDSIHITELDKENYITAPKGYGMRDSMDERFARHNVCPHVVIETADTSAASKYVYPGLGFALLPKSVVIRNPELRKEAILVTGNDMSAKIGISWNKEKYKAKIHELFLDFLKEHFIELEHDMSK